MRCDGWTLPILLTERLREWNLLVGWLVHLPWRARLQPGDPGWLDLAFSTPPLNCDRARTVLRRRPQRSSLHELADVAPGGSWITRARPARCCAAVRWLTASGASWSTSRSRPGGCRDSVPLVCNAFDWVASRQVEKQPDGNAEGIGRRRVAAPREDAQRPRQCTAPDGWLLK